MLSILNKQLLSSSPKFSENLWQLAFLAPVLGVLILTSIPAGTPETEPVVEHPRRRRPRPLPIVHTHPSHDTRSAENIELLFKYASPDDIPEILRLIGSSAGENGSLDVTNATRSSLLSTLSFPNSRIGIELPRRWALLAYPAHSQGRGFSAAPCALAIFTQNEDEYFTWGELAFDELYVEPNHRGLGIERRMVQKVKADQRLVR